MTSWKRYLVGVDGSGPSREALRCAIEMAARFGGTVTGLNVVDLEKVTRDMVTPGIPYAPIDIRPLEYYNDMQKTMVQNGKDALDTASKIANESGIGWEASQTLGLPLDVLARAAKAYDCLFLGERGRSDLGSKGPGRDVLNMARHCPRPVLVAEKFHAFGRALIAYDGSPEAAKALRVATDLGGEKGYEFHLVTISEPTRAGETTIEEARAYLEAHNVKVTYHLVDGDPAIEIQAKAAEFGCGMVIMGAFGHRTLLEHVFGSTAEKILNECELPVLLAK